jgi:hypothetical protein
VGLKPTPNGNGTLCDEGRFETRTYEGFGFLGICFLSPFPFMYETRSAKHFERILAEFVCARIAALSKQTNCVKRRQKAKRPFSPALNLETAVCIAACRTYAVCCCLTIKRQ